MSLEAQPERAASPIITRSELILTIVLGVALAVGTTWPLALNLGTHVPGALTDPLAQAWMLSWGGHQLLADPGALWQGNVFAPIADSYAFSDTLLGYAPLGFFGPDSLEATLVRYNLAFLLSYALCFVGVTLLARELGASRSAGAIAGVAFAWAPWRAAHDGHLNVLSAGGIALAAFLLVRGYRRRSAVLISAGWVTVAWQLLLGFAIGLWFAYALAVAGAVVVGRWLVAGRPALGRPTVVGTAVGLAVVATTLAVLLPPYLRIVERYPEARRPVYELDTYSPTPRGLVAAPVTNKLWGEATADQRDQLTWATEQARFPGLLVVVLAGVGLVAGLRRRTAIAAVAGLVVVTLLALGTRAPAGGRYTYLPLYEHAPGWSAMRTPGRLMTFTSMMLAVLAALGATVVVGRLARWLARRATTTAWRQLAGRAAVSGALAAVVLAEGLWTLRVIPVPTPPLGWPGTTKLAVHLPYAYDYDQLLMAWSTDYYPRIVNGSTSFQPPALTQLKARLRSFPSEDSVAALRELGIESVVVHRPAIAQSEWASVLEQPYDRAALRVDELGELVIYTLR